MIRISFLRPIDQFDGTRRLLQELKECLNSAAYNRLHLSVAFAKSGPLLRLSPMLRQWRQQGKTVEAIIGVDLLGTSKQALELALQNFDKVYILHSETYTTFHPKFYLFSGEDGAVCFQGSHNLTVGGTETNLEGGVKIEMDRPEDEASYNEALSAWTSLLPDVCNMTQELDNELLQALFDDAIVFDENVPQRREARAEPVVPNDGAVPPQQLRTQGRFPRAYPRPATPIPREAFPVAQRRPAVPNIQIGTPRITAVPPVAAPIIDIPTEAFVIQIVPHHNAEVFVSVTAINQNPHFFGYPFTGLTRSKFVQNQPYPKREPNPIVNFAIYDAQGDLIHNNNGHQLYMIYYAKRSEIRITFPQDVFALVNKFAIMVMRTAVEEHDYDINIFNDGDPRSEQYQLYLNACNQQLRSGGADRARRMGWL